MAFFLLLALMGQVVHSDVFENMGPGVWTQSAHTAIDVKIKHIDEEAGGYRITYEQLDDHLVRSARLCTGDRAVNQDYTEADRALAIHERIQSLREAKNFQTPISINVNGPWHVCIWPDYL